MKPETHSTAAPPLDCWPGYTKVGTVDPKQQSEFLAWLAQPDAKVTFKSANRVIITIPGSQPQLYRYRQLDDGNFKLEVNNEVSSHGVRSDTLPDYSEAVTPTELTARLNAAGFRLSQPELALVLGRVAGSKISELEKATGWKRSRIHEKSNEPTIKKALDFLHGIPLCPIATAPAPEPKTSANIPPGGLPGLNCVPPEFDYLTNRLIPPGPAPLADVSPGKDLRELDKLAASIVQEQREYYPGMKWHLDQAWKGTPSGKTIYMIRWCPRALLDEYAGPELLKSFVEILETAKYGDKAARAAAWKELALLTKPGRGNPPCREFAPQSLGSLVEQYHCRVTQLKREWKAMRGKPYTTETAALEQLRKLHPDELARFTDNTQLRSFLLSEALEAACHLTAQATGIDPKTFKRFSAYWQRTQDRWYRRAFNPFAWSSTRQP